MEPPPRGAPSPEPTWRGPRAAGREVCQGWGMVVTDDWRHELCPGCQASGRSAESVTKPPGTRVQEQ